MTYIWLPIALAILALLGVAYVHQPRRHVYTICAKAQFDANGNPFCMKAYVR